MNILNDIASGMVGAVTGIASIFSWVKPRRDNTSLTARRNQSASSVVEDYNQVRSELDAVRKLVRSSTQDTSQLILDKRRNRRWPDTRKS